MPPSDRTARLLSPKTRQLGQDVSALDAQVQHKLSLQLHEQQDARNYHEHLIHSDSIRQSLHLAELNARKTLRQQTDLFNALPKPHSPPTPIGTPGISALLSFQGEFPPPLRRSEFVRGLAAQVEVAKRQRLAEIQAEASAAAQSVAQDQKRREIELHENSIRKQLLLEVNDVNARIIEQRKALTLAEKAAAAEAEKRDIEKCLERVQHKEFAVLSLEEQKKILEEQEAQVAAKAAQREAERREEEAEAERLKQVQKIRDQIAQEELRERKSLVQHAVLENRSRLKSSAPSSLAFEYDSSIFSGFGVSGR